MRIIFQVFLVAPVVTGFIFPEMLRKPGLNELVESQPEQRLAVSLDIGKEGGTSRMAIKGIVLDLSKNNADYEHIAMPGTNGPHSKLSGGIRSLNIIKEGYFINNRGTQVVKTMKGCWELVWKKDAPAGALLCGFEVPEEYKRNEATLPKGRMYLSFPVWTKETLAFARSEKVRIIERAKECLGARDEELAKMDATPNPLMKALYYRNAYAAVEQYYMQPLKRLESIPDEGDIIAIQDDLFLTTKGLVWSKNLPRGEQVLLGAARLAQG
jgi:hypothetical protein